MGREPTIQELRMIDALMEHSRTTCGNMLVGDSNAYFNEAGAPRCEKCAIQYRIREGKWPHGAALSEWRISVNLRLAKPEKPKGRCDVTMQGDRAVMFECCVRPGD